MSIKLVSIMAVDLSGGIGYKGQLPWQSNRADMRWFKDATLHQQIIVSPTTYYSIPNGLPERHVIMARRQHKDETREIYLEDLTGHPIAKCFDSMSNKGLGDLPIVIGGKKVYESFEPETVTKFITIIPGHHVADTKMNLEKLFDPEHWEARFIGGSILKEQYCYLVILDRKGEKEHYHGMVEQVNNHFEPYVKLTLKEGIVVKPNAHGVASINEFIVIPKHQTGIFSIRKSLAIKGLYTSGQTFSRNWLGYPQIIITNQSLNEIELPAGTEIGELALLNSNYTG